MRLSEHIALLREEFLLSGLPEARVSINVNCDGTVGEPSETPVTETRRLSWLPTQFTFTFTRPFAISEDAAPQSPPATP